MKKILEAVAMKKNNGVIYTGSRCDLGCRTSGNISEVAGTWKINLFMINPITGEEIEVRGRFGKNRAAEVLEGAKRRFQESNWGATFLIR